jgi:hypothetical protein
MTVNFLDLSELVTRKTNLLAKDGHELAAEIRKLTAKKELRLSFQYLTVLAGDKLVITFLNPAIGGDRILTVTVYVNLDDLCNIEDAEKYKFIDQNLCTKTQLENMPAMTRIKLRLLYVIYLIGKQLKYVTGLSELRLDPEKNVYVRVLDSGEIKYSR